MANVLKSYVREFTWEGNHAELSVVLDVAEDNEGYGVVIGDEVTDETVAFGHGPLARELAERLYLAVINEIEQYEEGQDISDADIDSFNLETLYNFDTESIEMNDEKLCHLSGILEYINKWGNA